MTVDSSGLPAPDGVLSDAENADVNAVQRWLKILVGVVSALLAVVLVQLVLWSVDAVTVHRAICNLRDGAQGRVTESVKSIKRSEDLLKNFTDADLRKQFHLTRKQANEGLQDQRTQLVRDRATVRRLNGVDCGGWWG